MVLSRLIFHLGQLVWGAGITGSITLCPVKSYNDLTFRLKHPVSKIVLCNLQVISAADTEEPKLFK